MHKRKDPLESLIDRVDELDSTSRANLISRLARERALLSQVFNALKEGVLVVQASGILEYANASAVEMLGLNTKDLGTVRLWKAVPELTRTLNLTNHGYLQESANVSREVELTYPERRIVRIYIVPMEAEAEEVEIVQYAVIVSDITKEKTQTKQEIEDERVNSVIQLAAGVAHELGNPLNSLNIHLQVIRRKLQKLDADTSALETSLGICTGEVDRLDSIITHFLDAIRPKPPDLVELDLIRPLEESLEFLRPELEGAGLSIDIEIANNIPVILGDRDQLKQVFFNIIKNARQAMLKSGGSIRIQAHADDDFVYIRVGDTGEGITKEDLRRVFQPYFSTKTGGHGLGMMIVERIMREHGGQIGIDSRRGVGTLVTLQFPQKHRRQRMLSDR